jgi:hypothetical protein
MRIESSRDFIAALDNDTVLVRVYEFLIEEDVPLRMQQFTTAMSHEFFAGLLASELLRCKILECIRELNTRLDNYGRHI